MKATIERAEAEKRRPCQCRLLTGEVRPVGYQVPTRLTRALSRLQVAADGLLKLRRPGASRMNGEKHFVSPVNRGTLKNADVMVVVGDPKCGGKLFVLLKIEQNRIRDIKYRIFGCSVALATASVASEMAEGKTLQEVAAITEEEIAEALGGLPEEKMHCLGLTTGALRTAVGHYRTRMTGKATAERLPSGN